jgi:orotidine-5'-phosphate decarboxylase
MSSGHFVIPTQVEESHNRKKTKVRDVSTPLDMTNKQTAADKIIVALDVTTKKQALTLVGQLRDQISFFKIGLQLYTAAGPEVAREVMASGARVFLDLKLHDIPNTTAKAVESASQLGVQMLSLHLSGGTKMIKAAISARSGEMFLLGVTLLTSVDEQTVHELGMIDPIDKQVSRLAKLGVEAGIDGLIASPREVNMLRREFGDKIKIVAPGVRPTWSAAEDQKRFLTPREALEAGADYLVIGRPIIVRPNPADAVKRILAELVD